MPGNIRKASHFFSFLRRILIFLNNFMQKREILFISTDKFIQEMNIVAHIDENMLKFANKRF